MNKIVRKVLSVKFMALSYSQALEKVLGEKGLDSDEIKKIMNEASGYEKEKLKELGYQCEGSRPVLYSTKEGLEKVITEYDFRKIYPQEERPFQSFIMSGSVKSVDELKDNIRKVLLGNKIEYKDFAYSDFDGLLSLLDQTNHQIGWEPEYSRFYGPVFNFVICPKADKPRRKRHVQSFPIPGEIYPFDEDFTMQDAFPDYYEDDYDTMGSKSEHGWTCNVCEGDETTGCLFNDISECPRWT